MTTTKEAGRRGGLQTAKRGKKYYREIQKLGVAARMKNKEKKFSTGAENQKGL